MSPTRPANTMVRCALDRWMARQLRADNTSVIVVMINVPGERRERSASSASTVSISSSRLMSESEDEMSESELSDSDLIDSFAPDIDMEEDEESCDSGPSLPVFWRCRLDEDTTMWPDERRKQTKIKKTW